MSTLIFDQLFLLNFSKSLLLLPYFLFAIFVAFYIPGDLILGKIKQNLPTFFERIVACFIVGFTLWAYQGVVFGYLNARYLTYAYLGLCIFLWAKNRLNIKTIQKIFKIPAICFPKNKLSYILLFIFVVGIFGQVQKFWVAGNLASDGIHIFAAAGDDALWHTALISQLARRFPPFQPGLVNEIVHNYHYWSNLVIAELVRVFHLPILQTQYQYMYLLMSLLLGGVAYTLAKKLNFSGYGVILLVYLQYFSSDILYLFTFVTARTFNFSIGALEGGVEFLENPPRAFSIVIALCGILFLKLWLQDKKLRTGIITALLFGSIIGFKAHTAIPVYIGIAILSLLLIIKREIKMLLMPILTAVLALFVYLPVNISSGKLILTPFWITRDFAVHPDLHLSTLELARQTYALHANWLQALRMDITMLFLFLLSQFGIKNVGWIPVGGIIKKLGLPLYLFLYAAMISGVILGTFFYQESGGANIFNFFLASSLLLSIPMAFLLGRLLNINVWVRILLVFLLLAVTIPRWMQRNQSFLYYFKLTSPIIDTDELRAMDFVRNNTDSEEVVLVFNEGSWDSRYPYVSAFTQRDMYLSGQWILESHNILEFKDREKVRKIILASKDVNQVKKLLKENNISILYFYGKPVFNEGLKEINLIKIFENDTTTIYRFSNDNN
ncbi:MAG: hypothetical protein HYT08_02040 [Candidatus Levybacteria bacterium]|nr:hypothetical protein [Candidatus Levybacteria bacterium]